MLPKQINHQLRGPNPIRHPNHLITTLHAISRRDAAVSLITSTGSLLLSNPAVAEESADEMIQRRAMELQKKSELEDQTMRSAARGASGLGQENYGGGKTIYDFDVMIGGKTVPFAEAVGVKRGTRTKVTTKVRYDKPTEEGGEPVKIEENVEETEEYDVRPGAILLVNIKQDDPMARKNIPQLIQLAGKYGVKSESNPYGSSLAVVCVPTDQGYYEPDTSALLRLKVASEYGYGLNPSTILLDKTNLLGSGADPMMRWVESTCRTPAGLGRIELNFEKFLIDGKTGLPVRRYPRKYAPITMEEDITSLLSSSPLPPARGNYLEEWRDAAREAEISEYAFRKGLNYYDQ